MKTKEDKKIKILKALKDLGNVASTARIHAAYEKDNCFLSYGYLYVYLDECEQDNLVESRLRSGGWERQFKDYREWRLTGHGLALVKDL